MLQGFLGVVLITLLVVAINVLVGKVLFGS